MIRKGSVYFHTQGRAAFRLPSSLGTGEVSRGHFLEARGDILRYTDIGTRAFPNALLPPYGPGKPQPIGGC